MGCDGCVITNPVVGRLEHGANRVDCDGDRAIERVVRAKRQITALKYV